VLRSFLFSLALASGLAAGPAFAAVVKLGDLTIETPWARATPKGADVGVGYLTIHNDGATPDKLTGGAADFANVEIHQMANDNGTMTMREMVGGLDIPAHGTVTFAPSGYHLMFTHLKQAIAKGSTLKVTLTFEHAGSVSVDFPVAAIGASAPPGAAPADSMKGMSSMKGMKM
jgi:copper(I)-binding protein